MSTTAGTAAKPGSGCGGDGCDVRDPWPLLSVRHRGNPYRLCTSCVLRYHPGSFCALCFELLDAGNPAGPAVVHCLKCPSVGHLACLPSPDLGSQFVCPSCKNPDGFSYFPKVDGKRRVIDLEAAKALNAAARLSLNSITRAAAGTRAEAERKMRDALVAKKRARELIETSIVGHQKEVERNAAAAAVTPKPTSVEEPKKKWAKVSSGAGEQKRGPNREIEKWMRMLPVSTGMAAETGQMKGNKDKLKGSTQVEAKGRVPGSFGPEEKEKKGNNLSSQINAVKEGDKGLVGNGEKGTRLPQASQDALASRTNPRTVFSG